MSRRKQNTTCKKTLFERENGRRIEALSAAQAAEIQELRSLGIANSASSADPDDYMWDGGKNEIDAHTIIASGFSSNTALEDFLLAITDKETNDQNCKPGVARKKSERKFRFEQVARKGAPKRDYEPVLSRVAERFHRAYFGFENSEASLDQLLWAEIGPTYGENVDPETRNNLLKPYRREWKIHRDRLLLRVTEEGSALANQRARTIAKLLTILENA